MAKGLRIVHPVVEDRSLTHFGGIFLIHRFCQKLKLRRHLQKMVRLHQHASHYHPADLVLAIVYALIVGIPRLSKTRILQGNGAFQRIVGLDHYPCASSLRRFLKRAEPATIQDINRVHDHLRRALFYLPRPRTSLLFDFDSSVLTVYGRSIEGTEVGYNPHRRGARSYQPLLGFESHTKEFWHGILRPGNVQSTTGAIEFLQACLAKTPPYIYRRRLRADAGFYSQAFIKQLEVAEIGYVIVARLTNPIKRRVGSLRYRRFRGNWGAAEFSYRPYQWERAHRFIVIRRPLPDEESEQTSLFHTNRYAYQVFVTNLMLQPAKIWYFYRGRATIELNIRELKASYALAKIPTNRFLANQAYFSLLLLAHDIVNWFRRLCLPPILQNATVETIRTELLVLPARLVRSDNRNVLRLPAEYISKQAIEQVIRKIEKIKV